MLCLYDDLYEPPTTIEIIFNLVYYIDSKFSLNIFEKEVKLKAVMMMVIRYTGYVFESISFTRAQIFYNYFYIHVFSDGIMHALTEIRSLLTFIS